MGFIEDGSPTDVARDVLDLRSGLESFKSNGSSITVSGM